MKNHDETKKAYKETEVSKIWGIPLPTLRNDRFRRRGLPYTRKGKSIFYMAADIEEYFKRHTIRPEESQDQEVQG